MQQNLHIKVDSIKWLIIITAHLLIRVHLIRRCYPSLSAISDMGIKCWTCFWVILGAQRATTYTPLNQWGLGFVVKPRAQRESVFPEQSPCPRSGLAVHLKLLIFQSSMASPGRELTGSRFLNPVWFEDQTEQNDSCILHSRTEHLNPIVKKQHNNKPFLWQRLADDAVFMICLHPPLIPTLHPPVDDKKKIPFLISSDRAWPRLPRDGCMVAWRGLLRPRGFMMEREKVPQILATMQQDATWGTLLLSVGSTPGDVVWEKKKSKHAHGNSKELQHTTLQALVRQPEGFISVIQHWSISCRGLTYLLASKLTLSPFPHGPAEGWKVHQAWRVGPSSVWL